MLLPNARTIAAALVAPLRQALTSEQSARLRVATLLSQACAAAQAKRLLIDPRRIDFHTNVIASKVTPGVPGSKPCEVELTDFTSKEVVDTLEVDAVLVATGRAPYTHGLGLGAIGAEADRRGFVPVNEHMQARPRTCCRRGRARDVLRPCSILSLAILQPLLLSARRSARQSSREA